MEDLKKATAPDEVEQAAEPAENGEQMARGKMFTQDEVNEIVQRRLAKERKSENKEAVEELAAREKAVLKRELRAEALDRLRADDMPVELADLINCDTAEGFENTYKAVVSAFRKATANSPRTGIKVGVCTEPQRPVYTDKIREAFSPKI